jgi:hypothetical protein
MVRSQVEGWKLLRRSWGFLAFCVELDGKEQGTIGEEETYGLARNALVGRG